MNKQGEAWRGSDSGIALLSEEERAARRAFRAARAKAEKAAAEREEARMAAVEKAARAAKAEREACNADVFLGDALHRFEQDDGEREEGPEAITPAAPTPQAMKKRMREAGFHPDTFTAKKDGTFEARAGYFYRHGRTAEGLGETIKAAAEKAGLGCTILKTEDHWNAWPRTSYFLARFILTHFDQEEHDLIIGQLDDEAREQAERAAGWDRTP